MRFINSGSIKTFQQNITTSGIPETLTSFPVPDGISVVVKAKNANTGTITLGGTSAQALNTGTSYFPLLAGQAASFQVNNPNLIWFDGTVSNDGIEVAFEF